MASFCAPNKQVAPSALRLPWAAPRRSVVRATNYCRRARVTSASSLPNAPFSGIRRRNVWLASTTFPRQRQLRFSIGRDPCRSHSDQPGQVTGSAKCSNPGRLLIRPRGRARVTNGRAEIGSWPAHRRPWPKRTSTRALRHLRAGEGAPRQAVRGPSRRSRLRSVAKAFASGGDFDRGDRERVDALLLRWPVRPGGVRR